MSSPKVNSSIKQIQQEVAKQRELDLAKVRSGVVSAAQLGRENGAFGHAVASKGGIDWSRASRVF